MKKSLIISLFTGIALLGAAIPAANAQVVYPYTATPVYTGAPVCLDLTSYLSLGSTDAYTGGQVTELQEFLNRTGYLSGVSGTFDQGTYGAVYNYQIAHGIQATGTVGPLTLASINSQSCSGSYGSTVYPSSSNSSCYWSGGTYVCGVTSYPVNYQPTNYQYPTPIVCGYNTNGIYNNYGYNNNCYYNSAPRIASLSSNSGYAGATITINGSGFSLTGNTVHFGNTIISNVSSNGSTMIFTVPVNCTAGSYNVSVTNAQGIGSNSLVFTANIYNNGYPYNNNGYYNNGSYNNQYNYNSSISLSNISGPSIVQTGTTNTWSITVNGGNNGYYSSSNETVTANWGDNIGSNANDTQTSYTNGQTFTFAHTYEYPGTYTLRITATNSQGVQSYSSYIVTVNGNGSYYYYNNYNY